MNPADVDDRPLPTDWIRRQSKSRKDKYYYFNTVTRESSWKLPIDIPAIHDDSSTHSKGSVSKKEGGSDGSSTRKNKKKSKKHKMPNPEHSVSGKLSTPTGHSSQEKKLPKMTETMLNSSRQEQIYSNSKAYRISAWVDSVDTTYTPSEQGSCVSEPCVQGSYAESDQVSVDDFPLKMLCRRPINEQNVPVNATGKLLKKKIINVNKINHNARIDSKYMSHPYKKGYMPSGVNVPLHNGISRNFKQEKQTPTSSSTIHTPFSPLSRHPTVPGTNSHKTDSCEKLVTSSVAYQTPTEEEMPLDSQISFNSYGNAAYEAETSKPQQFDSNDVAMEIDNYEELKDQIRAELQGIRSEFVLDPLKVEAESSRPSAVSYKDTLYVILDTNVLLSHLKLISELKDFPIEGVARPVLVVPWIVIQELDSLKSDSWRIKRGKLVTDTNQNGRLGVDILARQAVRFLHLCFESNHARVRGQTVSEAREMMESCTIENPNNDDKILQCCLLFQRKAENGFAVLFSNDQNLCSKAIINGIKAFNHQSLVTGLKELFQSSALVLKKDYFQDYYKELQKQEVLAEKRAKADDLVCELQCVMREGLAVVVETEMRAAYEDLWDKIVFIKPPWTLADLLQLLDKHWIAVFGQVFKRNIRTTVENLRKHFSGSGGSPGCLANASVLLDQAYDLFECIAQRSCYNGAITKCVTAILILQRKCKEFRSVQVQSTGAQSSVVMGTPQVPALHGPGTSNSPRSSSNETVQENFSLRFEEGSEESSIVHEINTAQADSNPHALVLSTFETIWNAVNQFSAQIFNGVGFPHPIPQNVLKDLAQPSREQAVQFLSRLCSCLAFVVTAIQSVLQEPKGSERGNFQMFENLLQAVTQFFQEILSMNTNVTATDLFKFARDPNTRMGLIQGCSQLDRALATLQQCSTWVVSSEL